MNVVTHISLAAVLILGCVGICGARTLTTTDINNIKADLTTLFEMENSYGSACNPLANDCTLGDVYGAIVRLAFHDATGGGGVNGCIDFLEGDNNGLQEIVEALDTFHEENYADVITKADLWILAGNLAIAYATTDAERQSNREISPSPGTLELPFRYGRKDTIPCDHLDEGLFPSPNFTWSATNAFFGGRFGMNPAEVIAILGGHSLGRCQWSISGFEGGWITQQSSLSNEYYRFMGTAGWRNDNTSLVWLGPQDTIMLKSDAELLFETYSPDVNGYCTRFGGDTTGFDATNRCPHQEETVDIFLSFADLETGNTPFFGNFSLAWQKMTEHPYTDDDLAEPDSELQSNPNYPESTDPTFLPTASPSSTPTFSPSAGPTFTPSSAPTHAPSSSPTFAPTNSPTIAPTNGPTTTAGPTANPTIAPTSAPTIAPTLAPTDTPSGNPTQAPVVAGDPSSSPTLAPTIAPTLAPTDTPSGNPTQAPVVVGDPSSSPTLRPSTRSPTRIPTALPTESSGGSNSSSTGGFLGLDEETQVLVLGAVGIGAALCFVCCLCVLARKTLYSMCCVPESRPKYDLDAMGMEMKDTDNPIRTSSTAAGAEIYGGGGYGGAEMQANPMSGKKPAKPSKIPEFTVTGPPPSAGGFGEPLRESRASESPYDFNIEPDI